MLPFHITPALAVLALTALTASKDSKNSLHGEYRDIQVIRELEAIRTFQAGDDQAKEEMASQVDSAPEQYAPAVFFHLAVYLHHQGRSDEALQWLYRARIRTYFDIQRCTDHSVGDAGAKLNQVVPSVLKLEQFMDLEKSKRFMQAAIQWDRDTPHDYDPRWIALHGIEASLPESPTVPQEPLTIPEEQWEALAEQHRRDYLDQWMQDISALTPDELEQIRAKYEELRSE